MMDELSSLVERARSGDMDAFGTIVSRFQDMALAYAYSLTGDFHLAEDAAQEAFVQAYRDLASLREPNAFPGWFRKIVFKHCDRIKRQKRFQMVPLDSVVELASLDPDPAMIIEQNELQQKVLQSIRSLPDHERTVSILFYINGYTQKDIAEFLETPVTTINNRLHSARSRLKERMVQMVNDEMKSHKLGNEFPERIKQLLALPHPLTMKDHPVSQVAEAFRQCFPDFEEIELDEVYDRKHMLLDPKMIGETVYAVDESRILRPELTSQLVNHWMQSGGGPCKLMAVGRVFRAGQKQSETILEVHHQAEILWAQEGLTVEKLHDTVQHVASQLLPAVEFRIGTTTIYPPVHEAWNYTAKWRDRWLAVAAGGIIKDEWLTKAGLDSSRFGAIGFAFGLERSALAKLDLDDVHELWQPPFVP